MDLNTQHALPSMTSDCFFKTLCCTSPQSQALTNLISGLHLPSAFSRAATATRMASLGKSKPE